MLKLGKAAPIAEALSKLTMVLIILASLIFAVGCSQRTEEEVIIDPVKLKAALEEELDVFTNVKLAGNIENFNDRYLSVVSHDLPYTHYVGLANFSVNKKDGSITISGARGSSTDTEHHLSFSTSGATPMGQTPYLISYGEIYDDRITRITLQYNDGQTQTQDIENQGYIFIAYGDTLAVSKLTALNQNNEVIYTIP